jgi:hypothetical protein
VNLPFPPEILIARLRQQLAGQLGEAYQHETEAQKQRIETEQERAALGRAERQYLEEIAKGQLAQAGVLGQDRVAMLQALEKILASLERQPELVSMMGKLVPNTVVNGSGLEGAAAILSGALSKPRAEP